MGDLSKPAAILVERLRIRTGDRVVILGDDKTEQVAEALYKASLERTSHTLLVKTTVADENVFWLASQCDVIIVGIPHDYRLLGYMPRKDARAVDLEGMSEDAFARAVDVDYEEISKLGVKLSKLFRTTARLKIETEAGTQIWSGVGRVMLDCGHFSLENGFENLPTGEVYLTPKDVSGVFVVDEGCGECDNGAKLVIRKSRVQEVIGDKGFFDRISRIKNGRVVCEFGFGLNQNAMVSQNNITESEKMLGSVHTAVGGNRHFFPPWTRWGFIDSTIHVDLMGLNATVWADGTKILEGGEYLI